ncbi:hypothetical protein V7S43_009651 [Phytophthora oleae]|uniref:Uncharacterized protein n=1 Tax=Phytophthora oleae TaxID=2107226 RepID=A0ABD3FI91_9STRA
MARTSRVSAVEDELELAERSPEPSPEPPMLPPFRPRRPAPPPPPEPPAPARRSLGDLLPRRSLLAPEEAKGGDSDERKSEDEPENEKPKDQRPRKKRRSRILSELRPVEGPESALPSVPAIKDDDSQADDPLEAPDSGERAKEAFAAQRVRMKKSWCPDLRIYMKNAHPLFGICVAHRFHPYKRGDRFLVLLVALLVALLLCGLFAIRECCSEVLNVPVAVVNRRLETNLSANIGNLRGTRRTSAASGLTDVECLSFYANCSAARALCAEGSTCRVPGNGNASSSGAMQCVPDEEPSQKCVVGSCPRGWTCSESTQFCIPASNVCYLSTGPEERTSVQLAAADGTFTAIEAIFQILQIAANKHEEEMQHNSSTMQDQTDQFQPPSTSPPSTSLPATSSPPSSASNSSSSSQSSASSSDSVSSSSSSSSNSSESESQTESATVKVTMTEPVNGGVYSLSSTMLVEWHVTLLSGPDPGLDTFRVDFSADNGAFDTIATNVSVPSSLDTNTSSYQFEWDLADNISWLCTTCVLRICALDVASVSTDSLCIRSDGKSPSQSRRLQSTTVEDNASDVTFQIVREAFECSCGLNHESFWLAAVIIGVCIPIIVLLAKPLVTFYRDRQVFGLFARRDGPARPVIAGYTSTSATRKGRVVLVVVLLALCVACGFVAAQITTNNFLTEKEAIIVLWVVTFAIAVAVGLLVYCTLVWFVLFNWRWWRERSKDRREPSRLSQLRSSLLSDDVDASNASITSPTSPGWTVRGSGEQV